MTPADTMNDLETQIELIDLKNAKQANAYVFTMVEEAFNPAAELFVIAELPVLNPAAAEDCQRIAQAIASSLRRSYRKQLSDSTFENALTHINDELGKLASLGKTHWIGKLNCLLAVRTNSTFTIATTGKISALLFRDEELTNIADTAPASHALKTFENFAVGKLKLGDVLILSTKQLFNYISIDRVKNILARHSINLAKDQLVKVLTDNAGPEVAFGTIIAALVESKTTTHEELETANYMAGVMPVPGGKKQPLQQKVKQMLQALDVPGLTKAAYHSTRKLLSRDNKTSKPGFVKNKSILGSFGHVLSSAKGNLSLESIRASSKQKKFFLISALILLIVLVGNVVITNHYKKTRTTEQDFQTKLASIQSTINDANAAYLYKDEQKTRALLVSADQNMQSIKTSSPAQAQELQDLQKQLSELRNKIEKKTTVSPTLVATLSNADSLIVLPNSIGTETNRTIVSYNKTTNATEDGTLKSGGESIAKAAFIKNNSAVTYNGKNLFVWNFSTGVVSTPFLDNIPEQEKHIGLKFYATNSKVYILDTQKNRVVNYTTSEKELTKPAISITNVNLGNALDLAVDGNIYILATNGILKYQAGKPVNFPALAGTAKLGDNSKIYTDKDLKNIYVLDSGSNTIFVLDKQGALVTSLVSPQFTGLKDMTVDEKTKTIFVLNGSELLKFNF